MGLLQVVGVGVAALVVAVGARAQSGVGSSWSDDFERADGPLGAGWSVLTGSWGVSGNRGAHLSTAPNEIAFFDAAQARYTDASVQLDVFCLNQGSQYSGVAIGVGGADTILVKVQDQDGLPGFSHIGLLHRTGATSWNTWNGSGTGIAALSAHFDAARLTVSFPDADTIRVELDTNFDGAAEQVYSRTGVAALAANLGTGFGVAAWGSTARFDNFKVTPEDIASYCDAGVTWNGCAAQLSATSAPRLGGVGSCQLVVDAVEGQRSGLIFYGLEAQWTPWCVSGGTSHLCVSSPLARTPVQSSGGSSGACDGTLSLDWNAFLLSNPETLGAPFSAGQSVYLQAWFSDPTACRGSSLSTALRLTCVP
ncbi:MAG: hypothetical protein HUU28_06510 [Planctomycetaceae bacterium]|nr:hypothetical protein [Planctomycetaceae bacterium]